jgi:hypothetical protein
MNNFIWKRNLDEFNRNPGNAFRGKNRAQRRWISASAGFAILTGGR